MMWLKVVMAALCWCLAVPQVLPTPFAGTEGDVCILKHCPTLAC